MIPDYPGCLKCPLKDRPPVYGSGPDNAKLMVIGEAPGSTEVQKKVPFVGMSGKLLRSTLDSLGYNSSEVYYTNACLCNPLKNKTPTPTAVNCCSNRLREELDRIKPEKILTVGGTGLQALISPGKSAAITKFRGQGMLHEYGITPVIGDHDIVEMMTAFVVPTYHPAAVTRDPDLFRDFTRDITKILAQDAPFPEPRINTIICTSTDEAIEYLEELSTASQLSCDLETTGFSPVRDRILSFGFGALVTETPDYPYDGVSVIMPQGMGVTEDPRFKKALWFFIKDYEGPLIFHNLKFDLQFLQVFFEDNVEPMYPEDTMLMQYALDERGGESEASKTGRSYHIHGLKDQARIRYDIPDYHFNFEKFYKNPGVIERVQKIYGNEYTDDDRFRDREAYDLGTAWKKDVRIREISEEEFQGLDLWNNMFIYQGLDCFITARLFPELLEELNDESDRLYGLVKKLLIPGALFFTQVELTGAPVDLPYLEKVRDETQDELDAQLVLLLGYAKDAGMEEVNFQSPPQVKDFLKRYGIEVGSTEREALLLELHRKLPNGKPMYSEEVSKMVHLLSDYRQKARTLQKDIQGLLDRVDSDSRIRPDYLLHGSSTGRLACRDPNLQNIPTLMGPIIRNGFVAGDENDPEDCDYLLMEADESQLELRVAAWESQDEAMIENFKTGGDIHRKVASDMFKKPQDQITKHERYLAKYVDFGVIYGRGAKSLTEGWEAQYVIDNLGGRAWTLREAQKLLDDFLNGVPGLKVWIEGQHKFVRNNYYVETAMGRRRRFPLILRDAAASIERQAVNTPIQSLGSDIVLSAAIRIQKRLPEGATILPIIVHDSIMLRVRRDLIEYVHDLVEEELETPPFPMNVPLKADFKIGWSWGKMVGYSEYNPEVDYVKYSPESQDF